MTWRVYVNLDYQWTSMYIVDDESAQFYNHTGCLIGSSCFFCTGHRTQVHRTYGCSNARQAVAFIRVQGRGATTYFTLAQMYMVGHVKFWNCFTFPTNASRLFGGECMRCCMIVFSRLACDVVYMLMCGTCKVRLLHVCIFECINNMFLPAIYALIHPWYLVSTWHFISVKIYTWTLENFGWHWPF